MAEGLTPEYLTELKAKNNIVDVISSYYPLQKRGGLYKCCCPFHHEKTPSFIVNENEGYYHCFGCGVSGDVINFIMETESLSFFDAVKYLSERVGMKMPERKLDPNYSEKKERLTLLKELMRDAALYYHGNLVDPVKGAAAREYLKNRGISEETCKRYGMGLSLDRDSAVAYLRRKNYSLKDLADVGLIASADYPYDSFGNRIIVPIFNSMGEVVAFGGRIYHGEKETAKYKNSTNTVLFDKGHTIYGVNFVKADKRKSGKPLEYLILVEGYMDVISLGAAGIKNAVAGMGTALTDGQAKELSRLVDKIYVCYDGDGAGRKATIKNLDALVNCNLDVRVVELDDGKDPDETVRTDGVDGFMKHLDRALPAIEYKLKLCERAYDLNTVEGRAKYVKAALTVLKSIGSDAEREVYLGVVSTLSRVSVKKLEESIVNGNETAKPKKEEIKPKLPFDVDASKSIRAARFVLNRAAHSADYVDFEDIREKWFENETHKKIVKFILSVGKGNFTVGDLISEINDPEKGISDPELNAVLNVNLFFASAENDKRYYFDCLSSVADAYLTKRIATLNEEYKKISDEGEKRQTVKQIAELQKKLRSKNIKEKID